MRSSLHRDIALGVRYTVSVVRLSVNVNKIATLRNSRIPPSAQSDYAGAPSVARAIEVCLDAGARGITVHPRLDQRHVTTADVVAAAAIIEPQRTQVEFNIEGDPRADLLELVHRVRPHQLTLVPVRPGEITSEAGWSTHTSGDSLVRAIADARAVGIRVSLFVDPDPAVIRWAASMGADRIELYTEPYASAARQGDAAARQAFEPYVQAARLAHSLGLGVNAGHDLDLNNLRLFRTLPHLDEVSIGHALIAQAVFEGLDSTVKQYLEVLKPTQGPADG